MIWDLITGLLPNAWGYIAAAGGAAHPGQAGARGAATPDPAQPTPCATRVGGATSGRRAGDAGAGGPAMI